MSGRIRQSNAAGSATAILTKFRNFGYFQKASHSDSRTHRAVFREGNASALRLFDAFPKSKLTSYASLEMNTNWLLLSLVALAIPAHAALITAIPGPDDQGGMIMPKVSIAASAGTWTDPTAGTIKISLDSRTTPVLQSTQQWTPGDWYASDATWRNNLGSPAGVGGTPAESTGGGDLFNNQYGFMFMSMGNMMGANIPSGNALGIRLSSVSSSTLKAFNYGNFANRWDQVFDGTGSQVLWNATMWHTYFTLPANSPAGNYSATFEVFIASIPFNSSTGFAQYDSAALTATKNTNFDSAFMTYNWTVVPEPSALILLGTALGSLTLRRRR